MPPFQKRYGSDASACAGYRVPIDATSAHKEISCSFHSCFLSAVARAAFLCGLLCLSGCAGGWEPTPAGAVVGRAGRYDYSPSVIQVGQVQKFWWCGQAQNPDVPSQNTDTILYETIDLTTGLHQGPQVVLAETPGKWDSAYVCNPQVVQGTFSNPLGDGATYTYALYYVGTNQEQDTNNNIGVAFSNDGLHWKKYPSPVIRSTSPSGYGPAEPVPFNSDGKQAIWVFYENDNPPLGTNHHTKVTSSDGVHFTEAGAITTNGLNIPPALASWGDMAYNNSDGYWYASFNLPMRARVTTGNLEERGSLGIQLYRIPQNDLLDGKIGWQELKTYDTNLTGFENIFIAGFLRDPYGNLFLDDKKSIQIFPSFSNRQISWNDSPAAAAAAADVSLWDIGQYTWLSTESPLYALKRYNNGTAHLVTTGWVDPKGGFSIEKTLGRIYQNPQQGATVALYGCKAGATDAFLSLDGSCEGKSVSGLNGYLFAKPVPSLTLSPLYRCSSSHDHFASSDPQCEGGRSEQLLGYILPE